MRRLRSSFHVGARCAALLLCLLLTVCCLPVYRTDAAVDLERLEGIFVLQEDRRLFTAGDGSSILVSTDGEYTTLVSKMSSLEGIGESEWVFPAGIIYREAQVLGDSIYLMGCSNQDGSSFLLMKIRLSDREVEWAGLSLPWQAVESCRMTEERTLLITAGGAETAYYFANDLLTPVQAQENPMKGERYYYFTGQTVADLERQYAQNGTGGAVQVKDNAGVRQKSGKVRTGWTVEVLRNGKQESLVTAVVKGDLGGTAAENLRFYNEYLVGRRSLTGAWLKAADMNEDGAVDVGDLLLYKKAG